MKVLKEGPGWSAKITCTGAGTGGGGCGSLLEIKKEDLFILYGGDYIESVPYASFRCPRCEVDTCLEDEQVDYPKRWKRKGDSHRLPDRPDWLKLNY